MHVLQDMQCVENCDDPDISRWVLYEQPVWQTLQMFRMLILKYLQVSYLIGLFTVGEMLC